MANVFVKPALIQWARERSRLSVGTLLSHFPKLEMWERGEAQPTLRQLEDFAKKTLTPFGYLFLSAPPEETLPVPDFRTVPDTIAARPSPNLLETVQIMLRRQRWMSEYLIEQGQRTLSFVTSVTLRDDPNAVAAAIRHELSVVPNWTAEESSWTNALRLLRSMAEKIGILTVFNGVVGNNTHRKLDVAEFRGFVLCDQYAPLIFVNSADAKAAQMFTLAHELAHLWVGRGGVFNLRRLQPADNDQEKFCDSVAAEFLVPGETLRSSWAAAKETEDPFQALAQQFKVSPLVSARRALDLGFITKQAFFEFYDAYMADVRRRTGTQKGGGDFYLNQDMRIGRRFAEAIIRAAKEGRLLYRDAYQLTGLTGDTFDRYAGHVGQGHDYVQR